MVLVAWFPQWGSTIKSPLVCTVRNRYPSWYYRTCFQGVRLQQTSICLFGFYILATFRVIWGRTPLWDSAPSWRLYSAAWLDDQVDSTKSQETILDVGMENPKSITDQQTIPISLESFRFCSDLLSPMVLTFCHILWINILGWELWSALF